MSEARAKKPSPELTVAEEEAPTARAWRRLMVANEALISAWETESGALYRSTLLLVKARAEAYLTALAALIEEEGA